MNSRRIRLPIHEATLILVIVIAYLVLNGTSSGTLLSEAAFIGLLGYLSLSIVIGFSQLTVLAVGQLNLAVGPMGGTVCAVAAVLMAKYQLPVPIALIILIVLAVALGAVNGLLVNLTELNSFIITLATMTVFVGVQYGLVGTSTVSSYSAALKGFGSTNIGGVPLVFLGVLLFAGALSVFYRKTRLGRRSLATGANSQGAFLLGIVNKRSVLVAHTLSGLCVGVAALLVMTSASGINRSVGGDWLLLSFAAPIIGGIALSGGRAPVLGTLLAATLLRLIDVARSTYALDPSWVNFVIGGVVLVTVALSELRRRTADRRVRIG